MEDKRRSSSEEEYDEILRKFAEQNNRKKTADRNISSDSSVDVYIGSAKRSQGNKDDVYISKGHKVSDGRDIYSYSDGRIANFQGQVSEIVKQQEQPEKKQNIQQPLSRRTADKYNTLEVENVSDDGDEYSDFEDRTGRNPRKKRKRFGKGFIVLAVIVAVIVGLSGFFYTTVEGIVGRFSQAEEIEHIDDVDSLVSESYVRNILLIGTDKERGGSARSDSMMIVSVNKQNGKITVVSILRDTHLDIPGEREAKVNAAYAWGGPNLLVQTVEHNFGIKIDDYATVNFEMFTAIVDALGGIEVDVSENEADYINNRHKYGNEEKPNYVESGENVHLDGYQALWYARIRKLDSDFYRTERQRKVIAAIVDSAKTKISEGNIAELVEMSESVAPYIETTLSTNDFISLMTSLVGCFIKSSDDSDKLFVSAKVPFDDTWEYTNEWDGSSISIDLEKNKELLYDLLYEGSEEVVETEKEN